MTISIILPTKDTAPYLPACLDSILAQTYENWELIAVNDDSSDDSLAILESYAQQDSRIRVYTNPKPGLLKTLQFGYSQSMGELFHRMDSDDIMPVYKLQSMYDAWLQHGKGSVITGGTEYFSDEGEVGDGFKRYDAWLCEVARNNSHAKNMYRECVIPSNCWLVHRKDFDAVSGFYNDVFPEDYDLCFRFFKGRLKIVGLDLVLHYWRDRPDRISRNWECYKDNRFFELKIAYFCELERDQDRPLVLWGAGKNGKDLAKLIQSYDGPCQWVCDNDKKIGKDIYGTTLQHYSVVNELINPQIIIAVASPDGQKEIHEILKSWNKIEGEDYWLFS
ncbi:MAG: glycosyltransferase family 2 protein [Crocinitomicaceae bacterium]|nr:glycosyltransferase family 2 protein [Crocinitomicaceae bacterium]